MRGKTRPRGCEPRFIRDKTRSIGSEGRFIRDKARPTECEPRFMRDKTRPIRCEPRFMRDKTRPKGSERRFIRDKTRLKGAEPRFIRDKRRSRGREPRFIRDEARPRGSGPRFIRDKKRPGRSRTAVHPRQCAFERAQDSQRENLVDLYRPSAARVGSPVRGERCPLPMKRATIVRRNGCSTQRKAPTEMAARRPMQARTCPGRSNRAGSKRASSRNSGT